MIKPSILLIGILIFSVCPIKASENIVVQGLAQDMAIVLIDGKRRILRPGRTSPEGIQLISANNDEAVLEFNGEQKRYTLGSRITTQQNNSIEKTEANNRYIIIAPDSYGMYAINGTINRFSVNFLVDTGATYIAMNKNVAKRIGIDYKLEGTEVRMSTASGIDKAYQIKLDRVKIGDIELRDVDATVTDSDFPDITLLGNSFLNRLNMSRDGRVLKLEKKY